LFYAAATSIFRTGLRLACLGFGLGYVCWLSPQCPYKLVRRNKLSGNHFRRRYQTAPWDTFVATRPSSQITLGRVVISCNCKKRADRWQCLATCYLMLMAFQSIVHILKEVVQSVLKSI